ncbi:uncharacterized protein LOC130051481 [Ostrea edulis]|uniref:uncharacterized protein LOC130051481 n=1 Tax=Ostrea edulis TaxID=37623 RepID=UPI0024AFA12B|nr:uncharacterized protein LOC130051481 [Ostrea edulis]
MWKILSAYGLPDKIVALVKAFYNNYECCVIHNGKQSDWFNVHTGVRQGCIISLLLFITAIDWCMRSTLGNENTGIRWTLESFLEDLDFADDVCLISSNKQQMQRKTARLETTAQYIGLDTNATKTKVLAINNTCNTPIRIQDHDIEEIDNFTYLGAIISKDNGTSKDITSRISKARSAFCQLRPLWRSGKVSLKTKVKIYSSNIKSILLYGAECWKLVQSDPKKLSSFHNTCLRRICKIYWPKKISNKDLWSKTSQKSIQLEIKQRRWRWLGHAMRMNKACPANVALRWTPKRKRKRGRPKETWRRMIDGELKEMGLTWKEAEKKARDRQVWRELISALCADMHEED